MPLLAATCAGLYVLDHDIARPFHEDREFLALARGPEGRVCLAGTVDGQVYRSMDGGAAWDEVGKIGGFAELSTLAVDPADPGLFLAGMEPSALFRSHDEGQVWEEDPAIRRMSIENGWSVPWSDARGHVRAIAIDPTDPARVYLAIEVGGVVRTEDGGENWENVHGGIHDDVHSVAVNPRDRGVVYAATRHGFGRSEDHGRTWNAVNPFEGQGYCRPLAVDPARPERIFTAAATTGPGGFDRPVGAECGVYRSEDAGRSWTHLTNGLPARFKPYVDAIDVDPADPDHVALADREGHLFESRDGGNSWTETHTLPAVRRLLFTLPE